MLGRATGHTSAVLFYLPLLVLKFAAVLTYAAGLGARFVASDLPLQKRAVHTIASPALVLVWATGYGLSALLGVPLTELWLVGGLLFSLVSLLVLIYSVSRPMKTATAFVLAVLPLLLVLLFMVYRPRWRDL